MISKIGGNEDFIEKFKYVTVMQNLNLSVFYYIVYIFLNMAHP